jgi:phospholipase/lecithinase/hemolysin
MRKRLGLAVLTASLACSAAPASAFTALYSFGDSLSDVGNVFAASGGTVPAPLFPFPPGGPAYFDGRFSNGPNWVDDLSAKLGLGSVTASIDGGNDFAVGGAQTGPTSVNPGVPLVDLNSQVEEFGVLHPSADSSALYTLDIGANDIGNAISTFGNNPTALEDFLSQAVTNTVGAVSTLYHDGARELLYYEVPDLSLVPAFMAGGPLGGDLAMQFNEDVLAGIKRLETGPDPLTVFDVPVFSAIQRIVAYPASNGFANVRSPCISGGPESPGTGCADPGQYLFWDGEHPTAAGHALTADLAYAVLTGAPDPIVAPELSTWTMMLIGFSGLAFAGRRVRRAHPGERLESA